VWGSVGSPRDWWLTKPGSSVVDLATESQFTSPATLRAASLLDVASGDPVPGSPSRFETETSQRVSPGDSIIEGRSSGAASSLYAELEGVWNQPWTGDRTSSPLAALLHPKPTP
jgi:hypothetical protein